MKKIMLAVTLYTMTNSIFADGGSPQEVGCGEVLGALAFLTLIAVIIAWLARQKPPQDRGGRG